MPPRSRSRARSSRRVGVPALRSGLSLLLASLAIGLVSCAEPPIPETVDDEGAAQPVEVEVVDPARDALLAQLADLRTTVVGVRDELTSAREAGDLATARRAGERAVALLVEAPELDAEEEVSTAPLFPGTTTERGSIEGSDQLTATLTAARDAGGSLGRSTSELLRDPLAGDLGTWQQDPAGVVATVRSAVAVTGDLAALERAVLELPGEGTRALAWAVLAADARDAGTLQAYAERGIAHLDVIVEAIDGLLATAAAEAEADDPEPDQEDT